MNRAPPSTLLHCLHLEVFRQKGHFGHSHLDDVALQDIRSGGPPGQAAAHLQEKEAHNVHALQQPACVVVGLNKEEAVSDSPKKKEEKDKQSTQTCWLRKELVTKTGCKRFGPSCCR